MEILGWVWWTASSLAGLALSLVWFLIGGWVATLAQIAVLVLVVYGYKYGWRQAPQEALARIGGLARFAWAWVRARETTPAARPATYVRERKAARGREREAGDVNLSSLLNVLMLGALAIATLL